MSLRVALLNMMPDAALVVTERQFATLLGAQSVRDVHLQRFTLAAIPRGPEVAAHMEQLYRDVAELRAEDCDVLVITGANVSDPILPRQDFWEPLTRLMDWALAADLPVLCSCLATHAVLESRHGQQRLPVAPKVWGVYDHDLMLADHRLLQGLPDRVPVPHSRHNEVSAAQFADAGYDVLLNSAEAGPHLAVERERGRWLLLQGHPEYQTISLLKEYKREVTRWQVGQRTDYPVLPAGYLTKAAATILDGQRNANEELGPGRDKYPDFPETAAAPHLVNTWTDISIRIISNWLASLA